MQYAQFIKWPIWMTMCVIWCAPLDASAQGTLQPVDYVQPINWSKYDGMFGVQPGDTFGQKLIGILQNESRYELNWVNSRYELGDAAPYYPGVPYYWAYTNQSKSGNQKDIRPLASFAYGTATLLATKIYSPSAAGISEAEALNRTELAIRGVAFAHLSNTNDSRQFGGGGNTSAYNQAAYWTSQAASAAWLVWDRLSIDTRSAVANMVVYEADSFLNYTVPYWKLPSGAHANPSDPGDTKAEENAWNAPLLALAQAMMPEHPNVTAWREKASELQMSSYSNSTDITKTTLVDGKPVKDWVHGYNTFDDGVLVNHDIIHPDYFVSAVYTQTSSIVVESLAGQFIPQSTVYNLDKAYGGLTKVTFAQNADVTYETPTKPVVGPLYGQTIYQRTADDGYSGNIYYPQGTDWTYKVTDAFLNTDLIAEWLKLDDGKDFDAMGWAAARLDAIIALQSRSGTGKIYQTGDWLGTHAVVGEDEDFYRSNAIAWMQWWLMQNDQMSPIGDHWGALPTSAPESSTFVFVLAAILVLIVVALRRRGNAPIGNRPAT